MAFGGLWDLRLVVISLTFNGFMGTAIRRICQTALLLVAGSSLWGCSESRYPPTYRVVGRVTMHGDPVDRATVSFLPSGGQHPANGVTDKRGLFELSTFNRNDGAMPGAFVVTVQKFPFVQIKTVPGGIPYDPENETNAGEPRHRRVIENELPKNYADPMSSGFTATVLANDENRFEFDLVK